MFGISAIAGTLISMVSSAAATIGTVVAKTATSIVARLPSIVETAIKVVANIGEKLVKLAETFGIIIGCSTEELGGKAMQKGVRPREEDETMLHYMEYLKNEVTFDKEAFDKLSKEEKMARTLVGNEMIAEGIKETVKVVLTPDFQIAMEKMDMDHKELASYIEGFRDKGIDSMDAMTGYLNGTLNEKMESKVGDILTAKYSELRPNATPGEVQTHIAELREKLNTKSE